MKAVIPQMYVKDLRAGDFIPGVGTVEWIERDAPTSTVMADLLDEVSRGEYSREWGYTLSFCNVEREMS